jgi:dipeptidase
MEQARLGEFPRAISLFRTSYAIVAVAREQVPDVLAMTWLCQYAPDMSSFFPLYVAADAVPWPYMRGCMAKYNPDAMWWSHAVVGNYASRFYSFTLTAVRKVQEDVHTFLANDAAELEDYVIKNIRSPIIVSKISSFVRDRGYKVLDVWQQLLVTLITHYRDGYVISDTDKAEITIKKMFYPRW